MKPRRFDLHKHRSQFPIDADDGLTGEPNRGLVLRKSMRGTLTPTQRMRDAKGWLEVVENPPRADDQLLAIHGWLAPDGTLFACAWEKHNELATALGFSHESEIESAGYCKLSQLKWLVNPRYCARRLTRAQWKTIEEWYERNGYPEEHFIRLGTR